MEFHERGYAEKIICFEAVTSAREKLFPFLARDRDWIVYEHCATGGTMMRLI